MKSHAQAGHGFFLFKTLDRWILIERPSVFLSWCAFLFGQKRGLTLGGSCYSAEVLCGIVGHALCAPSGVEAAEHTAEPAGRRCIGQGIVDEDAKYRRTTPGCDFVTHPVPTNDQQMRSACGLRCLKAGKVRQSRPALSLEREPRSAHAVLKFAQTDKIRINEDLADHKTGVRL